MQMFTGVDEKTLATNTSRHYRLEFSEVKGRILIEVMDAKDSQDTDDDGDTYSSALAEQLRNVLAEKLE